MMKKAMVMTALFAFVAGFVACGGGLGGQVKGESFKTEGWVDNDTYHSTATGAPKEGLKNKVQRRGTAKEAAVLMAQEQHAHAVRAGRGQHHAFQRAYLAKERIGDLRQDARAIAGVRLRARAAAMRQMHQRGQGVFQ